MRTSLNQYRRLLETHLRPQGKAVLALAALLLTSILLQLANPQLLRFFIDTAQNPQSPTQALLLAAVVFIVTALITQLIGLVATYVSENVAWNATNGLRADLTRHCLGLDMSFHKQRTPGELIERIDGDVTALANFFSQFVIRVVANIALMIGVLVVLFFEDYRIGLVMTVLAALLFVVLLAIQRVTVPYWRAAREASARLFGFIEERLSGTEDLRSSGAIHYTLNQLYQRNRDRLHAERRAAVIGSAAWITPLMFFAIANVLTYWLGYNLYTSGSMTLGTIYVIFFYIDALLRPVIQITREVEDLQKAGAGVVRINELYAIDSTIADGAQELPEGALAVAFKRVSFTYDDTVEGDEQPVLTDVSIDLQPGRILGILGRTGSGKSTLTRLLFRLYDISEGEIELGGMNIRDVQLESLRRRVGVVTQDVQLFHATIRENLTLFDASISDEHILAVLADLELLPWYHSLPQGLDTILAAGDSGLSAGEAQVLAFTRIFLRAPGLVVLDEASSRLDPATERLIERAVDQLLADRTGIIIAHRLATVQRADDILILEDGRIREYGAREALRADPQSRFSELLRTGMAEVLT